MANWTGNSITNLLALVFNATTWTSIGQNAPAPATNIYLSLHNADPGQAGNQTTSETAYTNYVRLAVVRTSGGFTIGGSAPQVNVTNAGSVSFATCGATGDTLTHIGMGLSASGAGTLLLSVPIGPGPALGFTCTSASPGTLTVPGTTLAVNSRVSVYADATNTLSSGLTEGTVYFVGTAAGNQVTLSTTAGNANPVNTSSAGSGYLVVQAPLVATNGVTPTFPAGSIVFFQA